ncbi:hypothetical protein QAD02_018058 [Eretmocerus hayati]|uniref:Uncharacterized protein n=1 Tax=Eretmocerus hayati TaxID=131215 RepID=A0ACC2PFL3_9HYME|nr:hypothetical protein QAD02_018058 [Eretmocerus hayati]
MARPTDIPRVVKSFECQLSVVSTHIDDNGPKILQKQEANVSQAEYERAHRDYLTRLHSSGTGDSQHRRLFTIYATDGPKTREGIAINFGLRGNVEQPERALVESATLRILLDHYHDYYEDEVSDNEIVGNKIRPQLEIRVYRRERGRSSRSRQLVAKRVVTEPDSLRRRWVEFDLTDELARSIDASAPLALLIRLFHKDHHSGELRPAQGSLDASDAALNIHVLYLDDDDIYPDPISTQDLGKTSHRRYRRAASSESRSHHPGKRHALSLHRGRRTECRGDGKRCCRHELTVNFHELDGFDFIIQPKSFDAGYCKGRCPPRFNPAHHHALLQSLIWKEDRSKAPRPCCAPSKLAELEILYFDENDSTKLKVSNWKDMRVLECACS